MSQTAKILSNTFWQLLGRVITALIGIVSIKIITSYLPTEIYGQYTTVYEFIGFFAIAADFGLYTIGVREMAKQEKTEQEILANLLFLRLILIILTLSSSVLVAHMIPQYQGTFVQKGISIVALTTSLALLSGTLSTILQYRLKMHLANYGVILSRIIAISYIVLTVFIIAPNDIEKGFTHLLYAGLIANLVLISLTFYFVKKEITINFKIQKKYLKELTLKSLPYGLALILSTIYFKIDIILLGLMTNYHQVGIYGIPLKLMEILSVIPIFLLNSALPSLTKQFHKNKIQFQQSLNKLFKFLTLTATPILIGGIILAFPLTFIISNPQFLSGYHCTNNANIVYQSSTEAKTLCTNTPISSAFKIKDQPENSYLYQYGSDIALKLILIAMFFSFLNSLFSFTLVAIDKQSKLITTNAIGVLFNLSANLLIIPLYGFIGAAITTIVSEIIILVGVAYYAYKYTKTKIDLTPTFKIVLSGGIMGLIIYLIQAPTYALLQNKNILLLIPIGVLIYTFLILYFQVITSHELKTYFRKQPK